MDQPKVMARIILALPDGEEVVTTARVPTMSDDDTALRQAAETALHRAIGDVRPWLYRRTGEPPRPSTPQTDAPTAILPRMGRP